LVIVALTLPGTKAPYRVKMEYLEYGGSVTLDSHGEVREDRNTQYIESTEETNVQAADQDRGREREIIPD